MDTIDEQTTLQFETIIDGILTSGYGVADDFRTPSDVAALADQLRQRRKDGLFRAAGIGNQQVAVQTAIRGDEILWLDNTNATSVESSFLSQIDAFIAYVNRTCYLGLREFECHYALYPPGTFYKRHLDQFRTDSRRKLSVICYLNSDWQESDGGQLALYLPATEQRSEQQITINPTGGRLVCFESSLLEHEVLPATRERLSITGWLKTA